MSSVIINDAGLLYGGFFEGKPVWYRTKRAECVLSDDIAKQASKQASKQLNALEFKCVIRDSMSVSRKWVPMDLAATLDFPSN